jgi:membrane dipeptidase
MVESNRYTQEESIPLPRWFIVDAHVDLAYNAIGWRRNYRRAARWIRAQEAGTESARENGLCSVGLPDLVRGRVGIVFGTIFMEPSRRMMGDSPIFYRNEQEAHQHGMAQLDFYKRWADQDEHIRVIGSKKDLQAVMTTWGLGDKKEPPPSIFSVRKEPKPIHQVGIVPLMEGADPILEPKELERWAERGLRIVGPAWTGTRYSGGTHEPGGLTKLGRELLDMIASLDLILDVSHLSQEALMESLERFEGGPGHLIASHSNPQRLIPTDRHLPDHAIEMIAERQGVIGVVLFNRFLKNGWGTGDKKSDVTLDHVVRAIDYICQVTGSADYVGIGSDFDGGYGSEAAPRGLDTSRDFHRIGDELLQRGFGRENVEKVMSGNWLRVLRTSLP